VAKERLDVLTVARGLVASREQAQRLILAGDVFVDGHPVYKAGVRIAVDAELRIKAPPRFVSRGGEKLEGAFVAFGWQVNGLRGIDVGASTGGFTDCLLQHGARHVVAADVGRGQMHEGLRQDPRVTVMERCNVRHLQADDLPYVPEFAVFDVSFISLTLVMPPVVGVLVPGGEMVTLIKPQFEAGRTEVGRGGVVREVAVREAVVERIRFFGENKLSLQWLGCVESPLTGPAGNVEYLAWWRKAMAGI
jgi:23S rRNA (cytidine1920-2'-O)/16S rRNA (cytidine1409-2'-O)-methyltransferase